MEAPVPRKKTCLTCELGKECQFNHVIFSPELKYYILECLGPGVPRNVLKSTYEEAPEVVLDDNDNLKALIDGRALPQVRTFQVPIDGGYRARVRLFLPPSLRDDEIIKYPLILNIDGRPGSQLVTDLFQVHWGTYLASKKEFIYAWIDARGSGFRGDNLLHEVHLRLGSVEIEDQLGVIRYLRDDLPFVDGSRIALWGWAYGGFATTMSLAVDNNVFRCGIAVAPITNWLYHDSVYTERYMRTPRQDDNYIGYEKADITRKAANLYGKKFLLIHGTADSTVHIQHSMMLAMALADAGVPFQEQIYPDEDHSLRNVRAHLYRTMENFIDDCFNIPGEEDEPHKVNDRR